MTCVERFFPLSVGVCTPALLETLSLAASDWYHPCTPPGASGLGGVNSEQPSYGQSPVDNVCAQIPFHNKEYRSVSITETMKVPLAQPLSAPGPEESPHAAQYTRTREHQMDGGGEANGDRV